MFNIFRSLYKHLMIEILDYLKKSFLTRSRSTFVSRDTLDGPRSIKIAKPNQILSNILKVLFV
jgi:hypothetical protein